MSLRDLSARLRAIPVEIPQDVAREAAPAVEAKAKASVPVRTGRLRDSITAVASGPSVVVRADVDYAPFVRGVDEADYTPELDEAVNAV